MIVVCLLAVSGNIYIVWLLVHEGSMDKIVTWKPAANTMPAKLAASKRDYNGVFLGWNRVKGAAAANVCDHPAGGFGGKMAIWPRVNSRAVGGGAR